ncbi:hypothetical protein EDC04DRAFT_2044939 [Pisolithus marmoratus]|nr:hypothetical protein EDC04DRAFT_2044939 [Pisolithus marmoratus]
MCGLALTVLDGQNCAKMTWGGGWGRQDTKFNRCEFLSEVEQIKKWRGMLIATTDEHERRTLVEDTVGKILLACWRGVASEIVQVLRKVVDQYDEVVKENGLADRLGDIGRVFSDAIDYIPCNYPLQRIIDDAMHGVSKHELLLSERAELATLSNEARHILKRKRGTSVPVETPTSVRVKC